MESDVVTDLGLQGIYIGAATNTAGLANENEPQYKAVEQAQFSLTTAENACAATSTLLASWGTPFSRHLSSPVTCYVICFADWRSE